MKNNTKVETAQKSQATNKIQPENVQKDLARIDEIRKNKSKVPTGKVTLLKETEARKKAREEQYRNFRINALRRRCERYGFDEKKTEEFVKKLIEQMEKPNTYTILVMLNPKSGPMMKEALKKENINYKYHGDTYFSFEGDKKLLDKLREITPPDGKLHIYAKKMESVIPKEEMEVIKKPSNNTAEKKAAAKVSKKIFRGNKGIKHRQAGRTSLADIRRASRYVKKNLKKGEKIDVKKVFKVVEERAKGGAATTVQLNAKKSSTGSKKASTNLKKAA